MHACNRPMALTLLPLNIHYVVCKLQELCLLRDTGLHVTIAGH